VKKSSIISLVLLVGMLSCLDPGRDNPYDSENPDIAELGGTVLSGSMSNRGSQEIIPRSTSMMSVSGRN
jgi:hypothetical protein